jgi:hypothetical protein
LAANSNEIKAPNDSAAPAFPKGGIAKMITPRSVKPEQPAQVPSDPAKGNGSARPDADKPNTEPENIFADLKGLRKRTKTIDVSEHADIVDYRKPRRQEFFRIYSDPEFSIEADVFIDENDDDAPNFVDPDARKSFDPDDLRRVTIVVCINQFGVIFLWGVPVVDDNSGNRGQGYNLTAKKAAGMALSQWVRMRSIRKQRAYKIVPAEEEGQHLGEPQWPEEMSFADLLWKAFKGRIIKDESHPIFAKLAGREK